MKDITVSIITYNRRDMLDRVINSLEVQTYPLDRFEIVIVDDGSTDGTEKLMEDILGRARCDLRYIRRLENSGKSVVRNISVKNAKSPVILFLEDDTIADERLLEEHVSWHRRWPDETVAVLGREIRDERSFATPFGRYVKHASEAFFDAIHKSVENRAVDAYRGFITFNLSAKKSFIVRNGMFDSGFKYFCEDIELGYRLSQAGLDMKYNDKAVIYNYHPAFLDEYCRRNLNRGYFTVMMARKHPHAVHGWGLAGLERPRHKMKDLLYPVLMKISSFADEAGIRLPYKAYRKLLEYYLEKGMRAAQKEKV